MARLEQQFNAADSAMAEEGWHNSMMVESSMPFTKDGERQYFLPIFSLIGGPNHGVLIADYLNINHQNPQVRMIARRTMADICCAVGRSCITDTDELHNLPLRIHIRHRPAHGDYGPSYGLRYGPPLPPETADSSVAPAWQPQAWTPANPADETSHPASESRHEQESPAPRARKARVSRTSRTKSESLQHLAHDQQESHGPRTRKAEDLPDSSGEALEPGINEIADDDESWDAPPPWVTGQ